MIAILGALWWAFSSPGTTKARTPLPKVARAVSGRSQDYVGPQVCRDCHPAEYALYSGSGHARTLRPAARAVVARWLDGRSIPDPERPEARWSYHLKDGQLTAERNEGEVAERFLIDYAFGSGHHAVTFVSLDARRPRESSSKEHRLTYYAHTRGLGVTPGQSGSVVEPGTT